jgi:hypothetical protein
LPVIVGAMVPQLILPGYETTPLVTLDSVLALQFGSGAGAIVFALFAIAFALAGLLLDHFLRDLDQHLPDHRAALLADRHYGPLGEHTD